MEQTRGNGKMLAMCGLDCAACPAFIARKTDDQALRVQTAAEWSKVFNVPPAQANLEEVRRTYQR